MKQFDYGYTDNGSVVHIVDFDTDSMLARGSDDPDKARCGHTNDFTKAEQPAIKGLCQRCVDRHGIPDDYLIEY